MCRYSQSIHDMGLATAISLVILTICAVTLVVLVAVLFKRQHHTNEDVHTVAASVMQTNQAAAARAAAQRAEVDTERLRLSAHAALTTKPPTCEPLPPTATPHGSCQQKQQPTCEAAKTSTCEAEKPQQQPTCESSSTCEGFLSSQPGGEVVALSPSDEWMYLTDPSGKRFLKGGLAASSAWLRDGAQLPAGSCVREVAGKNGAKKTGAVCFGGEAGDPAALNVVGRAAEADGKRVVKVWDELQASSVSAASVGIAGSGGAVLTNGGSEGQIIVSGGDFGVEGTIAALNDVFVGGGVLGMAGIVSGDVLWNGGEVYLNQLSGDTNVAGRIKMPSNGTSGVEWDDASKIYSGDGVLHVDASGKLQVIAPTNVALSTPFTDFADPTSGSTDALRISSGAWTGSTLAESGNSEISNDVSGYNQLMIVGNSAAGGNRKVGIWDDLDVNGDFRATNKLCVGNTCVDEAKFKAIVDGGQAATLQGQVQAIQGQVQTLQGQVQTLTTALATNTTADAALKAALATNTALDAQTASALSQNTAADLSRLLLIEQAIGKSYSIDGIWKAPCGWNMTIRNTVGGKNGQLDWSNTGGWQYTTTYQGLGRWLLQTHGQVFYIATDGRLVSDAYINMGDPYKFVKQ
jgi:hypothetical protein